MKKADEREQKYAEYTKNTPTFLEAFIETSRRREYNDDHLTHDERKALVRLYQEAHPDEVLSPDIDEAFINIVL